MSFLGRVNYDFKGKYLLSGAIRRDGLSVWAPGKKWATFPSGSIGWRIDQEDFMQKSNKISELKLRAGYGVTGLNGQVLGNYTLVGECCWLTVLIILLVISLDSGPGSSIPGLGNKDLEWEKTKQLNIGLDLRIV